MKKNSCAFKNIVFIDWTRFRLNQWNAKFKKTGTLKCKNNAIQYFHLFDGYNLLTQFVEQATKNYLFPWQEE